MTIIPPADTNGISLHDVFNTCMPGVSPDVYGPDDFRAIGELVQHTAGIMLQPNTAMLVFQRLAPLVRESGCATFGSYVLRIGENVAERERAIAALIPGSAKRAPDIKTIAAETRIRRGPLRRRGMRG